MSYLLPVIAALGGAIVGSLLTAVLSHLATSQRERRQRKLQVLLVLMSGRGGIFSAHVAESVNIIPILFHDREKVRRAYQHFCAIPNGPPIDLYRRYNDLVLAVARSMGYEDLTAADVDLGFYPSPATEPAAFPIVSNRQPSSGAATDGLARRSQQSGSEPLDRP